MTLHIPNPTLFSQKLESLRQDGISKLHIVSDFDRTLTGQSPAGEKPTTSWMIFKSALGDKYTEDRQRLFDTYYPIERDNSLDLSFRTEQTAIWFKKHLDVLIQYGIDIQLIHEVLQDEKLKLRDGVAELFRISESNKIPFLIFSAGIGDAINMYLEMQNLKSENVHILSNFFHFDADGSVTGFKEDIVHTFNKTEALIKTKEYFKQIIDRPNCILLGDSIYDAMMTDGMNHTAILKIGFLNGTTHEKKHFEEVYDAIIEEDTDVFEVVELLQGILEYK